MPVSKDVSLSIAKDVLKDTSIEEFSRRLQPRPLKHEALATGFPKQTELTQEAQARRLALLEKGGSRLNYLRGESKIDDPSIFQGRIENFIGLAQIPIGIAGPLRINGLHAHGDFSIPLATVEGTLVASYNRGAKLLSLCGGATALCMHERVSRAPGFLFESIEQASQFIAWCANQFDTMKAIAEKTTVHGALANTNSTLTGNQVILNFEYTTGDATGQNMVTIATEAVCQYILANSPVQPRYYFIESNMSGDKKATTLSYLSVRGKKVTAEAVIARRLIKRVLHTTPETLMEYWKMSVVGALQSGSLGAQGHYANGLTALFLACGQDVACVAEAAVGITRFDLTDRGDFYASVTLPNLIVGTVGGGTHLPTQSECLSLLGCQGPKTSKKFAEICAATVLAGEISIAGALAAGQFTESHKTYARQPGKAAQAAQ